MKVLQVGMDWFPTKQGGGLDRYYYDCIRYLPEVGVDVTSIVSGPDHIAESTAGPIYRFAPSDAPLLQRFLQVRSVTHQVLKDNNFSLIAAHFALYAFPILDKIGPKPFVFHFHGPWSLECIVEGQKSLGFRLRKAMELAVFRRSVRFVVLSQAFQDILHQDYQVPLNQIHVVPGGVDLARFENGSTSIEARANLEWPQDRFILFTVRRLSPRMGLENLVAAMEQVRCQYPDTLLLIAGKGALEASLNQQIQALGLENHVQLLGYIPETQLIAAYRAADCVVIPTTTLEGFGLIVLEALASGTPVLGTPVGGIPEILRPFSPDLVLSGHETEHIAQGLLEVLSGQRILPSSTDCIRYVRQNYSWHTTAQRLKEIYESVLV